MLLAKLDTKNKLVLIFQEGMNKKTKKRGKKTSAKKNYFFTSLCVPQTLDQHSSSCIKGRGIFLMIANVEARILAEVFMKQGTKLER